MTNNETPFYRQLFNKLINDHDIEDIFIASALGVGIGCLY